jgi:hypothetical protein
MNQVALSLNDPTTITAKSVANCGLARMRRALLQALPTQHARRICTNERYGHYGRTHEESSNSQLRMTLTYAHEKRAKK